MHASATAMHLMLWAASAGPLLHEVQIQTASICFLLLLQELPRDAAGAEQDAAPTGHSGKATGRPQPLKVPPPAASRPGLPSGQPQLPQLQYQQQQQQALHHQGTPSPDQHQRRQQEGSCKLQAAASQVMQTAPPRHKHGSKGGATAAAAAATDAAGRSPMAAASVTTVAADGAGNMGSSVKVQQQLSTSAGVACGLQGVRNRSASAGETIMRAERSMQQSASPPVMTTTRAPGPATAASHARPCC
jgi:hypothetical protein